nr:MIF4G and Initiation factor eIF-4 gamma domain containing protein [Haemonchus contortus]
MAVVKSDKDGTNFSSRKQDRKKAKRLRKLQSVACARHQPIEKVMEEAFKSKKMSKKQKRKLRKIEAAMVEREQREQVDSPPKRRGKRDRASSESDDSDAELTYEQYLQEVQDKKRKIAIEGDDERQDDIDIHRYSKLLGIKEGKTSKKPKAFTNDGLDYLLDFCDSDSRKRILATSTDQEIALKGDDLVDEEQSEDEDDADDVTGEGSSSEDENLHDGVEEDEEHSRSSDEESIEENDSKIGSEDDYKEDIYGRTINKKTGKVVRFDIRGAHKKLEDLDAKAGDSEFKMKIDRILMGTLNRLSEGTLVKSCQAVAEVWQNSSKNDVKSCLTRALSRLVCAPYRLQDQLLSLYAMFLAQIHSFTSEEISAYFVEVFLREFVEQISQAQAQDDKKLENSAVFIAHLLNFHIIKATVIIEVFEKLREQLNVDNLQLVVVLATYSYKALRKLLWAPFSEELSKIAKALETAPFSTLPRAKFLGETLLALQKSPPTNLDTSVIEHHLKLFYGMRKKSNLVCDKELGMSLDDLLNADERGRWWVVGSAYQVASDGGTTDGKDGTSTQIASSFPEEIVQLARKAKMNTDVRRNIFCTVATSDDEDAAFERLLRLSLKGQQEREIIYVLIMMLLKEKNFNAFYPTLIARFCDFDRRFVLTTQYALWDRIREVNSLKLRARIRLADLIHHLISNEVLSITVLKVVEWGTLTAGVSSVIRRVFKLLSSSSVTKVRRIFNPLLVKDKNPLLTEGIRLFLSVNFPDSEVYKKIGETFLAS